MDVATVTLIIQVLVRYGPEAYAQVRKMLSGAGPTDAEWKELDVILAKPGIEYFPALKGKAGP